MKDYHINIFYSEDDGGYIADVPDLQACSAFGETPEAALQAVAEAKVAWLEAARAALADRLGEAAMVDAASVIGNFQRMVRIADSTGIPVDGFFAEANADVREQLSLNELPSARLG